jgi:hypothetical protein
MDGVNEKDVVAALRKTAAFVGRVERLSRELPEEEGRRIRHSAHSTAANLAMALDILRKERDSGRQV